MSEKETANAPKKSSIINYVGNFIEKRDNQLRTSGGDQDGAQPTRAVDRDAIVVDTNENDYEREHVESRASGSTDIDADEINLDSDPYIVQQEAAEQVYRQQVYLRQYQPPTPEPIDIQVQEIFIKPKIQRPPIHVHVGQGQSRDTQRTPSPILITSVPPQPPPPTSSEPLVYNKYVPVETKQPPQQIIIHRYADMPPKPRPIVVEQWLPNKPAPKRITYRHVDREQFAQNEHERLRNRYIEYTKPHTTIEVEIVRLPIIKLRPEEYQSKSSVLTQLDTVRSFTHDPNTIQWRI